MTGCLQQIAHEARAVGAQEQQRSYEELLRSTGSVNMQSGKICAYLGADVTDHGSRWASRGSAADGW